MSSVIIITQNPDMKYSIVLTICSTLLFSCVLAQNFEKVVFSDKGAGDYYIAVKPVSNKIKGVLVLLPGYAEIPESIFPETKLFNVAFVNDIVTIAVAGGPKLYADEVVIEKINRALFDIRKRYPGVSKDNFIIGGFSAGGSLSLRYTEYCVQNPANAAIVPKAVFAVDSPVDLIGIYEYFQREIKKNYSPVGVSEASTILDVMRKEIGTPESNLKRYNELTPFNHTLDYEGNEKYLKNVAVRVYEDIDIEWQLKERRRSLYDTNILNASELINRLMLMGNNNAEFIVSKRPGRRSNGMRHPHSWSIVDEVEFIQWASALFDAK